MKVVSAGDIEKYAYCPLSWWLSKKTDHIDNWNGLQSHEAVAEQLSNIQNGEVKQRIYNRFIVGLAAAASVLAVIGITVFTGVGSKENSYVFVGLSLIWLLNSVFFLYKEEKMPMEFLRLRYEKLILFSAMGAILISLVVIFSAMPESKELAQFLEILAVVWIVIANVLFYRSLNLSEKLLLKKVQYTALEDTIAYVGTYPESPLLKSERYGLCGKPDYIIDHKGVFVPVVKKTGRTPKGPLFSHIAQLITYCILVEESFGSVDYGLLKYDEKKYSIDYDVDLKETALKLRDSLLDEQQHGEVHRNHNRKGKCIRCSRRDMCPERLE